MSMRRYKEVSKAWLERENKYLIPYQFSPLCPHILDSFEKNGVTYLVSEPNEAITLYAYLKKHPIISSDMAISFIIRLAREIEAFHEHGFILRHVSPYNLLLKWPADLPASVTRDLSNCMVVQTDMAEVINNTKEPRSTSILYPHYDAPEAYHMKANLGPWTDVYSLAAVFYYLIVHRHPEEPCRRLEKHELVPPSELDSELPRYAESILLRAMALNPRKRTKSMKKFYSALENPGKNKTWLRSLFGQ